LIQSFEFLLSALFSLLGLTIAHSLGDVLAHRIVVVLKRDTVLLFSPQKHQYCDYE